MLVFFPKSDGFGFKDLRFGLQFSQTALGQALTNTFLDQLLLYL